MRSQFFCHLHAQRALSLALEQGLDARRAAVVPRRPQVLTLDLHLQGVVYFAGFGHCVEEDQRAGIEHGTMGAILFQHIGIVRGHDQRAVIAAGHQFFFTAPSKANVASGCNFIDEIAIERDCK